MILGILALIFWVVILAILVAATFILWTLFKIGWAIFGTSLIVLACLLMIFW